MKLSILTAVVIRLFAIYWAFACVVGILGGVGVVSMMLSGGAPDVLQLALQFAVPSTYGTMAFLAWIFADSISLRVVGQTDPQLSFTEVRPENFYTLGILGFGLYYGIGHLAASVNWIHYLVVNRAGQALVNQGGSLSLYDVTSEMIPCAAGTAIAVLSPRIGKKLATAGLRSNVSEVTERAGTPDTDEPPN